MYKGFRTVTRWNYSSVRVVSAEAKTVHKRFVVGVNIIRRPKYQQKCEAIYPKCTRKRQLVKLYRSTLKQAANTTPKQTQHTVKLHGCWTKLFMQYYTMGCHAIIMPGNRTPIQIQTLFTTIYLPCMTRVVVVLKVYFARKRLGWRLGNGALVTSTQHLMTSVPLASPYS